MLSFHHYRHGHPVIVTNPSNPLHGRTGKIHRPLMRDDSAWIRMDEPLPEGMESFPAGDKRHHDIVLWPDDCESNEEEGA
jgi:hypothetical protein